MGLGATSITNWFTWPSRFWSVGPALAETLFDGGLRRGAVQQSQATYDQTVANYRQTVLTAFQQVEDNLAALRILSKEIQQQDAAIASAQRNLQVANDRYRAGIDPYLNVITAQTTLLEQPANRGKSAPGANDGERPVDRGAGRRMGYVASAFTAGHQQQDGANSKFDSLDLGSRAPPWRFVNREISSGAVSLVLLPGAHNDSFGTARCCASRYILSYALKEYPRFVGGRSPDAL